VNTISHTAQRRAQHSYRQHGFTLIELLVATTLAVLLIVGLGGVVGQVATTRDAVHDSNVLIREARFAMDQMVRTLSHSRLLLLPLPDKPGTGWPENIREQTVPPSPPVGGSTLATAVLAVTLPAAQDLDGDGFADADDDRDGRIDEDLPADNTFDNAPGVNLIDDAGDGGVDEFSSCCYWDDDEYFGVTDEDAINGVDDDDDGIVDEDPGSDMNADGCPGVCGVDDDADGNLDEGSSADDDEDGQADEDWYNAVVFYLNAGTLMQRTPVPWDVSGGGLVSGLDYIAGPVAENVTRFRVERVAGLSSSQQLVAITLELTSPLTGEVVSLQTRVRVGGAL
jgi:prepilin-type N-terminal cleavage/methylation domain-containing protein